MEIEDSDYDSDQEDSSSNSSEDERKKIDKLTKKIKQLKKEKNFEIKRNEKLNIKIEGLNTKIEELHENCEEEQEKHKIYKSKYLKTKKIQSEKNKTNLEMDQCKYDVVVKLDSLINSNKEGWEVEYLDINKIKIYSQKHQIAIGVIGQENSGKTFIINKISQESFASGFYERTQGLSFKYCIEKEKQLKIFLDSAGMNSGILFNNFDKLKKYSRFLKEDEKDKNPNKSKEKENNFISKKKYEKIKELMINDRAMTEYFTQNFILYSCNIIMIVIEMITHYDQKIIERIKSFFSAKKTIIIVHNLFKLEKKEQVIKKAITDITGAFYVLNQQLIPETNVPYYVEESPDKNSKSILHLILGKENCESGDFFNASTLNYIKKVIETDHDLKQFDILDRINQFWKESYLNYFKSFQGEIPFFEIQEDKQKTIFKLNFNGDLEIKNPEFNVLGGLKNTEMIFHLYIKQHPQREKIYYCELPGCTEIPKMKMKNLYNLKEQYIVIETKIEVEGEKGYECAEGGLAQGNYHRKLKINDGYGFYDLDKGFTEFKNGILKLKFVLKEEEQTLFSN